MGRVVDVKAALEAWKPVQDVSGVTTIAIADETAPWNAGVWRVEGEGRSISVRPTSSEPDVSLDIQTFSQAFFGTPSVELLRAMGRIKVHREVGYGVFRDLLAGPPNWMNDDF
jgi:predicted acetyltransferase